MALPRVAVVGLALVAAGAAAVTVAWGFGALAVYAFFAAIAGAIVVGTRVGGDWLRDASSRRFDDRDRR